MKKIFVLDTNIPLLDPYCLDNFAENDIVIPSIVISELNSKKTRMDEIGKNARIFTKKLDSLSENGNLYEGVKLSNGGILKVKTIDKLDEILQEIHNNFKTEENDDYILAVAVKLHKEHISCPNVYLKTVLVTRDQNLRLKADLFKLPAEHYMKETIENVDSLYQGWRIIPVSADTLAEYYSSKLRDRNNSELTFSLIDVSSYNLQPNEYVVLVDEYTWTENEKSIQDLSEISDSPILKYSEELNALVGLNIYKEYLNKYNVFPKNIQQVMLIDLLFDRKTTLKSVIGLAGSGKTLFSLLISIIMTNELEWFDEIIITRPPIEMGYQLGFLPGNEPEKMDPYLRGFKGNMKFINNQKNKNNHRKDQKNSKNQEDNNGDFVNYKIHTESMTYMRGQTTNRQIIIIDESQNTTRNVMKTAITRTGQESIIIVLGDISQIDFHLLDATNNGLSHAVELMKDERIASHVTLITGERSELSEIIANKWDKEIFK